MDPATGKDGTALPRRPVRARKLRLIRSLAARLSRLGLRPNDVSRLSLFFSALTAAGFLLSAGAEGWNRALLLLAAAAAIPLRALCNVCDGLMAIEGGRGSPTGGVFNELPDRLSDTLLLASAGYAVPGWDAGPAVGWAAAAMAILTAYVRALGVSVGARAAYDGPMDKAPRMAVVGMGCLGAAAEAVCGWPSLALPVALGTVAAGAAVTVARRTRRILRDLESRGAAPRGEGTP
jgi:phosphatidylglycerophosphate synthase